jgi:hypothetical protein
MSDLSLTYHAVTREEILVLSTKLQRLMDMNKVLMALDALKLPSGFRYSIYDVYIDLNCDCRLCEDLKIAIMEQLASTLFRVFRCKWAWDRANLVTTIFGVKVRLYGFVYDECLVIDDLESDPVSPKKQLCGEQAILYREQQES